MGSIISAIHDDIEDYQWLCQKYGEKVVTTPDRYGNQLPDCYGPHAKSLEERERAERK